MAGTALADDVGARHLPPGVTLGGPIMVNGRVLDGHSFLRKREVAYFPLSVLSMALHHKVTYDLSGRLITCDRRLFHVNDALKINEFVYVPWRDLHRMMPDVRMRAGSRGYAFETDLDARTAVDTSPPPPASPTAQAGGQLVSVRSIQPRLDDQGHLVFEAILHNNTDKPFDKVFATLVLTDPTGATGNQNHVYAKYEQYVGVLDGGGDQPVSFVTELVNPISIDPLHYTVRIEVAGLKLEPVPVDLIYRIDVDRQP